MSLYVVIYTDETADVYLTCDTDVTACPKVTELPPPPEDDNIDVKQWAKGPGRGTRMVHY